MTSVSRPLLPLLAFVLAIGGTGCSKKEDVSFKTLEDARGTARDNAMWNAERYRMSNIKFSGWSIVGRGDSSQTNECPQGDGWATMDFVNPEKSNVVKVKCSTVSPNIGCLEEFDFKSKAYSSEDGHCQPTNKVPFPLPKVGN
jgi:hypothetical protein